MLKLYGSIASPYVARVVMYARLKGLQLPLEDPPGGGIKSPEYLQLSPIGKMPALDVHGQGLAESAIICEYLEGLYPDSPALPADPWERACSRLIARITDIYLAPAVSTLVRQLDPARRDTAVVAAAADSIDRVCSYLNHFMGRGPFCIGDVPTLGDCALSTSIRSLQLFRPAFSGLADPVGEGRLARWWAAVGEHPVCAPVLDDYAAALTAMMAAAREQRRS